MSAFQRELKRRMSRRRANRRWVFVPYDQLNGDIGPLSQSAANEVAIVMVESSWRAERRPYHKQKLALEMANMRQFAIEQAERGVHVEYLLSDEPFAVVLARCAKRVGPLVVMKPAERELRADLAPLVQGGQLEVIPHEGWLSSAEDFSASQKEGTPWRMDRFYRYMRKQTQILMVDGKPAGGKYSFDRENRQAWSGDPAAPAPPRFRPDAITQEVVKLVGKRFAHHPGSIAAQSLPSTANDAKRLWKWAKKDCLPSFGPYEDAMSVLSTGIFHTRVSSLVHLHRLLPRQLVDDVCELDIPLASKEGFVRQVLGWREFVRHVHRETDGFRALPGKKTATVENRPSDAGYQRWSGSKWQASTPRPRLDGGAAPNLLRAKNPVPVAFWGRPSGLRCLDQVVADVWNEAYSHHITRLMVLCNLAALIDVSPRELSDWFWIAYTDAYDWVVEPNVLGMGLFAVGDLMTTKPYIAGTPYINRMSDFCGACSFHPKKTCPLSNLYWAYLARHEKKLAQVQRMRVPLASLRKRGTEKKARDRRVYKQVVRSLGAGDPLTPETVPVECATKSRATTAGQ